MEQYLQNTEEEIIDAKEEKIEDSYKLLANVVVSMACVLM